MFVLIMLAVFYLTFNVVGSFFSDLLDAGIGALTTLVENALVSAGFSGVLRSLIIDGVFRAWAACSASCRLSSRCSSLPARGQRLHGAHRLCDG